MKKKQRLISLVTALVMIFLMFQLPVQVSAEDREPELIQVTRSMLQDGKGVTTGRYAPYGLFDEYDNIQYPPDAQDAYRPPVDPSETTLLNIWRVGGEARDWVDPSVSIDLRRPYQLLEIYFFDGEEYCPATWIEDSAPFEVQGGIFRVYAGEELLVEHELTNEGKWVKVVIPDGGIETQTLKFEKETTGGTYSWWGGVVVGEVYTGFLCDANIPEVSLYGIPLGDDPEDEEEEEDWVDPDPQPLKDFGLTFGEFAGTHGFFVDDLANYKPVNFIRVYHGLYLTEAGVGYDHPQTMDDPDPYCAFVDRWGAVDSYFQNLKDQGYITNICIQGGVSDETGLWGKRPSYQGTQDPEDPASYLGHARSMFQHVARYGSNKNVPPELVHVGNVTTDYTNTEKKIGMDLIEYYEHWNEPNATWETPGNQFTAEAYAAMASADYDGHMRSMGPDAGVKTADPNAKFVMAGLAGFSGDTMTFLEDMNKWFRENRTLEKWIEINGTEEGFVQYPFDVINLHHYCQNATVTSGISAEEDMMYEKMLGVMDYVSRYYPDAEVWLSEFGWDTDIRSTVGAGVEYEKVHPQTGAVTVMNQGKNVGLTGHEVQARWLVREYMILAAAGLTRVNQFMLDDSGTGSSGTYQTSGMLEYGTKARKPSWYYVGTMTHWLGSTRFVQSLDATVENMMIYEFQEAVDQNRLNDKVYSLWKTTSLNDTPEPYTMDLPVGTNRAYLVTLKNKVVWGELEELDIVDGKVVVGVSEKPIFVLARQGTEEIVYESEYEGFLDYADNSKPEGKYLLDLSFDDVALGELTKADSNDLGIDHYAVHAEVIKDEGANRGNSLFLRANTTDGLDHFNLDIIDLEEKLEPNKFYYLDYKVRIADAFSRPGVRFADFDANIWTTLMEPLPSVPFGFESRWWGTYKIPDNVWARVKIRFVIREPKGYEYEIFLNDESIVKNTVRVGDPGDVLPASVIRILFQTFSPDKHSIIYLDDLYLYEEVPPSKFFEESFDQKADGALPKGNGWDVDIVGQYEIVTPVDGDPMYRGEGNKVLKGKPDTGSQGTESFFINAPLVLDNMVNGTEFVVDFKFFPEADGTIPQFGFTGSNWNTFYPFNRGWGGTDILMVDYYEGGSKQSKRVPLAGGEWHQFRVVGTVHSTGISYAAYIDDMKEPVAISEIYPASFPILNLRFRISNFQNNGAGEGVGYFDDFKVYRKPDEVALEDFTLNKSSLGMYLYKTATLSVTSFLPEDTSSEMNAIWSVSDPAVLRLTGNGGQVKAVGEGTAVVSCEIDGIVRTCTVTVQKVRVPIESFTLKKETLNLALYKTATLEPLNVLPANTTDLENVKWFTSNDGIVTFTGNGGQIKAVKRGTAIITCQIGAVKVYCKVTVTG